MPKLQGRAEKAATGPSGVAATTSRGRSASGETARSALIRLATFAALAYLSRMPKILFEPCIPARGTAGTV